MVRVVENRNDGGSITTGVGTITARTDVVQEVESPSSLMSSHGFESPSPEQLALRRRNSTSAQLDPLDEFGLSSSLPFRPRPLLL